MGELTIINKDKLSKDQSSSVRTLLKEAKSIMNLVQNSTLSVEDGKLYSVICKNINEIESNLALEEAKTEKENDQNIPKSLKLSKGDKDGENIQQEKSKHEETVLSTKLQKTDTNNKPEEKLNTEQNELKRHASTSSKESELKIKISDLSKLEKGGEKQQKEKSKQRGNTTSSNIQKTATNDMAEERLYTEKNELKRQASSTSQESELKLKSSGLSKIAKDGKKQQQEKSKQKDNTDSLNKMTEETLDTEKVENKRQVSTPSQEEQMNGKISNVLKIDNLRGKLQPEKTKQN